MSVVGESSRIEFVSGIEHIDECAIRYRAFFFGLFRFASDGHYVGEPYWRRNKAKALLKWFILNAGRSYTKDQLIAMFWSDIAPDAAARNLHVTMHYLRRLLEPDLLPRKESTFLRRIKNNVYWFELDERWWTDLCDFHCCQRMGKDSDQAGNYERAIAQYRRVIEYCDMGFLPEDAYDDVFNDFRRHYDYIYTQTLERLIQIGLQQRALNDVFTSAHQLLLLDPYSEVAVEGLVHAYVQQGNIAGACYKLDSFLQLLREDLNIEPSCEFLALRESICNF